MTGKEGGVGMNFETRLTDCNYAGCGGKAASIIARDDQGREIPEHSTTALFCERHGPASQQFARLGSYREMKR